MVKKKQQNIFRSPGNEVYMSIVILLRMKQWKSIIHYWRSYCGVKLQRSNNSNRRKILTSHTTIVGYVVMTSNNERPNNLVFTSTELSLFRHCHRKCKLNRKKEIHFLKSLSESKLLKKELDFSADIPRFIIHSFVSVWQPCLAHLAIITLKLGLSTVFTKPVISQCNYSLHPE